MMFPESRAPRGKRFLVIMGLNIPWAVRVAGDFLKLLLRQALHEAAFETPTNFNTPKLWVLLCFPSPGHPRALSKPPVSFTVHDGLGSDEPEAANRAQTYLLATQGLPYSHPKSALHQASAPELQS